jgi:hypothetical protein
MYGETFLVFRRAGGERPEMQAVRGREDGGSLMAAIHDGGPAFPYSALTPEGPQIYGDARGMTLRDYFAGQALMGVVAGMNSEQRRRYIVDRAAGIEAEFVYRIADALIAQREK